VDELKEIIASNPETYVNYKKNGNKKDFVDCILDPSLEKCYTVAGWNARPKGGKFTRKR